VESANKNEYYNTEEQASGLSLCSREEKTMTNRIDDEQLENTTGGTNAETEELFAYINRRFPGYFDDEQFDEYERNIDKVIYFLHDKVDGFGYMSQYDDQTNQYRVN
jgi:hypothetical protein